MLAHILHPLDETTFLRDYWGQRPAILAGGDPARFDGWFDLDALEAYLLTARPAAGDVQLVRQGQWPPLAAIAGLVSGHDYDAQAVYTGLMSGYSIVLNAVHFRWPAVRRVTTALEDALLASAQANVYVTGPQAQGFSLHRDDHDVFVIQTSGSKRWVIREIGGPDATPSGADQPVLHDLTLRAGDALYLPAGYPHEAATTDEISVHISIGLFPLTWRQLAHDALDALTRDEAWQRPVPLAVLDGTEAASAAPQLADRLRAALAGLQDLTPLVERHRRSLQTTSRRKNPAPSGYARALDSLVALDVTSEVERRPGVGCFVTSDAASASISFMGGTVRAPANLADALRFIAATPRFRISAIAGLSDASKLVLVRRLVREGLLQPVVASTGSR